MFQLPFHTIRPATTAHLAQTMTMLSLTAEELRQQIESELAANPALELINERRCPTCHRLLPKQGLCPICSQPFLIQASRSYLFPREKTFIRAVFRPNLRTCRWIISQSQPRISLLMFSGRLLQNLMHRTGK
ncbi:MAG: hypothetical protein HPY59_06290 [Anaerolineae bacterium]|nr:hypothetical protein [Anaerolineae bacterium]